MKKILLSAAIILLSYTLPAQLLTWSPQFPNDNSTVVITVDASKGNQGLYNYSDPNNIYVHVGVTTNLSGSGGQQWLYVNGSTGGAWGSATPALKAVSLGNNKYQYTITNIRSFLGVPAAETIKTVNILFRDANASASAVKKQANTDGSDMFIPVYPTGANAIQFTQPPIVPTFHISSEQVNATVSQSVPVTAVASTNTGTLKLYFNGIQISGPLTNTNTISGNAVVSVAGNQQVVSELVVSGVSYYDTVQFYVAPVTTVRSLPSGVREGINYGDGCDSVTLVLFAPNKQNVVILGDFPGCSWVPQAQFQMYKTPDNNYYWFTIRGLTPGYEYSFQYSVDNLIYIADPYSEKILDPWNDQYIPAATYPNLKSTPTDPNFSPGKNGYVSVLQTCAPAYNWKVPNFVKPDKHNLVIYELLVRDFGAAKNYQMLIDSINYFKRLGINAIELMPVNEFSGNESWGYNPTFYCALDKAYGTKDKFKEFIDLCHQNGIAVILDVVYNHLDSYNAPEGKLYWDGANGKPAANNPWLNQTAPHPYGVFEDLNHTATATQYWVRRALDYWIKEYKVDGYRFDLAKGFTQTQSDGTTVENLDNTRVANLNRYYDYIMPRYPNTYMILEFLGGQRQEEQLYEAHGYLLWSECNDQYTQAAMGYTTGSDFSKIMYNSSQTSFASPAAVGYMESHDKDRLMYKCVNFGNTNGGYNVKDTATALKRMAAAASVFITTPGPKMIWQFGERGYDQSINRCEDGTISNDCRIANKPPQWEKFSEQRRKDLYNAYSSLINLRLSFPDLFNSSNFSYDFYDNAGLFKKYQISDNANNGMKLNIVANLDVTQQTRTISFQNASGWYNYLSNGTGSGLNGGTNATFTPSASQSITLQPGEYHVYLYHPANVYIFNGSGNWNDPANWTYNKVPPQILPSGSEILIAPKQGGECVLNYSQTIGQGAKLTVAAGKKILIPLNLSIQ